MPPYVVFSGVFILCQSTTDKKSREHIQDKNSCQIRVDGEIVFLYNSRFRSDAKRQGSRLLVLRLGYIINGAQVLITDSQTIT